VSPGSLVRLAACAENAQLSTSEGVPLWSERIARNIRVPIGTVGVVIGIWVGGPGSAPVADVLWPGGVTSAFPHRLELIA
jgi:hypothetical protein